MIKRLPGAKTTYSAYRHYFLKAIFYLQGKRHHKQKYYNETLINALGKHTRRTDISDHLSTIFYVAADAIPKLMVELGTRGGKSTRALLAAAEVTDSMLLSVDIDDCSKIKVRYQERWNFVQANDVEFGREGFRDWCNAHSLEPSIDVLYIDTSHEYEHTKEEIAIWSEHLSGRGVMIFHDTNMGSGIYARNDGSIGVGWNNNRGVIRAIEELVGRQYNEDCYFCDITDEYSIYHVPNCSGLTILKKR